MKTKKAAKTQITYLRASLVPGDDLKELAAPVGGFAKGAQFRCLSAGHDGQTGQDYRDLNFVGHGTVRFYNTEMVRVDC